MVGIFVFLTTLILAGPAVSLPGPAEPACATTADVADIMREVDPAGAIIVHRGRDAQAMLMALDTIFGSRPPPHVMASAAVGAYVSSHTGNVALRFFDSMNCDLGVMGEMSQEAFQAVLRHMGVGA